MVYYMHCLNYSQANKDDILVPSNPQEDTWLQRELNEAGIPEDRKQEFDLKLVEITKNVFEGFKKELDGIINTNYNI